VLVAAGTRSLSFTVLPLETAVPSLGASACNSWIIDGWSLRNRSSYYGI
jgi:hypothetical protein